MSQRPALTPLSVDSSQRLNLKSAKPVDKSGNEKGLTSTPLNASELSTVARCPLPFDGARRTIEVSFSAATEQTPTSVMEARRSAAEFRTPEDFRSVAFETPAAPLKLKKTGEVGRFDAECEPLSSSVTVAVRVRPFMTRYVFAKHISLNSFVRLIIE